MAPSQQLICPVALCPKNNIGHELGEQVQLLSKVLFILWGELPQVRHVANHKWKQQVSKR
jgi:hypothetical protein